jgi:hypothetical protein
MGKQFSAIIYVFQKSYPRAPFRVVVGFPLKLFFFLPYLFVFKAFLGKVSLLFVSEASQEH